MILPGPQTSTKPSPVFVRLLAVCFVTMLVMMATPNTALAACDDGICDTESNAVQAQIIGNYIDNKHQQTRDNVNNHMTQSFIQHHLWLGQVYFREYVGSAMAMMTEQFSAIALQQMEIVGTFFDAKQQMETNRLYQQLAAQAHKDYHPSEGMCTIGTAARNLAGTERDGQLASLVMSRRSISRQLMNVNSSSTEGADYEGRARASQFRETYCDKNDNGGNGSLAAICAANVPAARTNKDVDFARTLNLPLSLDVNLTDGTLTPDEEDLMALQSNLFAHRVPATIINATSLRFDPNSSLSNQGNIEAYLDLRSIVAKRSVAENSFQAIAGMKVAGTNPSTAQYLQAAVREINPGITPAEAAQMIGTSPSYYAQMEILTKKIIENTQFFTDLYDKPANVARKGVAIEAIGLIQDRDDYNSTLRTETMLSLLLELRLRDEQSAVQRRFDLLKDK